MEDLDLVRPLRNLRRTVDMLQSDLRKEHLNEKLLAEIETHMEHGLGTEPRCIGLLAPVDSLRASALTPRPELCMDPFAAVRS